jgi:hypothetical protein
MNVTLTHRCGIAIDPILTHAWAIDSLLDHKLEHIKKTSFGYSFDFES